MKISAQHETKEEASLWEGWISTLRRWGLISWTATVLDALGPLTILGAQALYVGTPVLKMLIPTAQLDACTKLLEDSTQTQAFIHRLQEEVGRDPQ